MIDRQNKENNWKRWFLVLLGINLFILIGMIWLIFAPASQSDLPNMENTKQNEAEFTVSSTKQNVNQLISSYLATLPKNKALHYSLTLKDDVELQGAVFAFNRKIPLTATFEPLVQENGDLILRQKSLALGKLELPNKAVLAYVRDNYPMPEWVKVDPVKEDIYVAVTKMETKSNFKIKAKQIDLARDQLVFTFTVPNDALNFQK
ncbi:YpmS family protein [Aneurinibacillus sp. REN35]|uniref:YpmS family protein n=1 Tax=Aneurinibacillus sp. REN35 TaxID=3237286 RepID=UPI003528861C